MSKEEIVKILSKIKDTVEENNYKLALAITGHRPGKIRDVLMSSKDGETLLEYIENLQSQLKAKEEDEKEFIKCLESEIRASESGRTYIKGMCFIGQREGLLEEILSKYKEIVEEKHEIQNK